MSFCGYNDLISEGDTVILYVSFKQMYPLKVEPQKADKNGELAENVYQTTYGALKVKDLVGKRYGTKVKLSRGYCYVLHPTPELWTKILPHRTQILYATDISMILLQLDLKPGKVVVESGTGSGSLSHSFIRTIAPTGHLHTFDFHAKRVEDATREFMEHKVDHLVTAKHADACADGFGLENVADAVFLDLPHPWEAVGHAKKALKKNGVSRMCSFSPCIEQVQKTAEKMRSMGFNEIVTLECLLREFQVRKITIPVYEPERETNNGEETVESKKRKLEESCEEDGDEKPTEEKKDKKKAEKNFYTGIPLVNMPGHTGYLTFATLAAKV